MLHKSSDGRSQFIVPTELRFWARTHTSYNLFHFLFWLHSVISFPPLVFVTLPPESIKNCAFAFLFILLYGCIFQLCGGEKLFIRRIHLQIKRNERLLKSPKLVSVCWNRTLGIFLFFHGHWENQSIAQLVSMQKDKSLSWIELALKASRKRKIDWRRDSTPSISYSRFLLGLGYQTHGLLRVIRRLLLASKVSKNSSKFGTDSTGAWTSTLARSCTYSSLHARCEQSW